jgi:hypothetical protein
MLEREIVCSEREYSVAGCSVGLTSRGAGAGVCEELVKMTSIPCYVLLDGFIISLTPILSQIVRFLLQKPFEYSKIHNLGL